MQKFEDRYLEKFKKFPNEFNLWSVAAKLPTATPEQIAKAKEEMKRLDPNNPDLR